jgi:hypothetical protein
MRNSKGQFVDSEGLTVTDRLPDRYKPSDYRRIIETSQEPYRVRAVLDIVYERAIGGSVKHAELYLSYVVGKPAVIAPSGDSGSDNILRSLLAEVSERRKAAQSTPAGVLIDVQAKVTQ